MMVVGELFRLSTHHTQNRAKAKHFVGHKTINCPTAGILSVKKSHKKIKQDKIGQHLKTWLFVVNDINDLPGHFYGMIIEAGLGGNISKLVFLAQRKWGLEMLKTTL